jgi:hypothetical protein
MQKLLVHSIFATESLSNLPVQAVKTKWHVAVLDLFITLNGKFILPQIVDGG